MYIAMKISTMLSESRFYMTNFFFFCTHQFGHCTKVVVFRGFAPYKIKNIAERLTLLTLPNLRIGTDLSYDLASFASIRRPLWWRLPLLLTCFSPTSHHHRHRSSFYVELKRCPSTLAICLVLLALQQWNENLMVSLSWVIVTDELWL